MAKTKSDDTLCCKDKARLNTVLIPCFVRTVKKKVAIFVTVNKPFSFVTCYPLLDQRKIIFKNSLLNFDESRTRVF